jgi:hypothetical protein
MNISEEKWDCVIDLVHNRCYCFDEEINIINLFKSLKI